MNTVLPVTRDRIQALGLACFELQDRWDLDDVEGLKRYLKVTGEM